MFSFADYAAFFLYKDGSLKLRDRVTEGKKKRKKKRKIKRTKRTEIVFYNAKP